MPNAICVYCSSSADVDPLFNTVADELGRLIAAAGHTLVYGGGSLGLMGYVARAVHRHNGRVVGVIPESMMNKEVAYLDADEMVVTRTMRERKAVMDERCDAFIALPGGFGTLEELIEVLTHRQLKYHDKPIIIVNAHGFYDPLLSLFEHFYQHRFAKEKQRATYQVVDNCEAAMACLNWG